MKWLIIFIGSGLGGCLRVFTTEVSQKLFLSILPIGTLLSNIMACLILGVILGFAEAKIIDEKLKIFFVLGVCGGYSTFSTFSAESLRMFTEKRFFESFSYIFLSIITCFLAVFIGQKIAKCI
jgi:fluoride exporter